MATELAEKNSANEETSNNKKKKGTLIWILLILFLILFVLTSVILGSRLYQMATRDKYSVDLGLGTDGEIELFKIEYENASGDVTVQGVNGENVIAPGTTVNYAIRLRNRDDVIIDFVLKPSVRYLNGEPVPVHYKLLDNHGNYLLGDDNTWVSSVDLNNLIHKGSIHPGEIYTYYLTWEWIFEVSDEQDAYDTYLANENGEVLPGVEVGFYTESAANPTVVKHTFNTMHILGEGFGCCWCCYLVWLLLLVVVILLLWIWRIRRKMNKQADTLDEYETVLKQHGLLVDGELVTIDHAIS